MNSYNAVASAPRATRQLNLRYLNLMIYGAAAGLGIFYLVNISNLTVLGFGLRDLKSEAAALSSEKMAKQEEVNRARSYQALAERTPSLNMVAAGEVEYIGALSEAVARK